MASTDPQDRETNDEIRVTRELLRQIDEALRDELDQPDYERVGQAVEGLLSESHGTGRGDPVCDVASQFEREQEIHRRAREIGPTLGGESTVDRLRRNW